MSASTMITVCATGAEITKDQFPALPTTTAELIDTAVTCEAAGASMIHVHVRDDDHKPTLEVSRLKDAVAAIKENSNLLVQLSTGGAVTDPLENRLRVLEAMPDSCSCSMGTLNFGDDVFMNPWSFIKDLYQSAREKQIVPGFEIFDIGQLASLERLVAEEGPTFGGKIHVEFIMGVPGGMVATPSQLAMALQAMPECVTSWSASGIGRGHMPIMLATIAHGGNLRVGMEDNTFFARGVKVEKNAQLVERAAQLAEIAQRPAMSIEDARAFLGIR